MRVSYKKKRRFLINNDINKTDLGLAKETLFSIFSKRSHSEFILGDLVALHYKTINCIAGNIMDTALYKAAFHKAI